MHAVVTKYYFIPLFKYFLFFFVVFFLSLHFTFVYSIADSPNLDDKYLELIQDSKVLNQVLALARSSLHPNSTRSSFHP